ncbi:MAG TPA: hypothetical protein VI076_06690, partial [Actinopolymorphaceae bacterium]
MTEGSWADGIRGVACDVSGTATVTVESAGPSRHSARTLEHIQPLLLEDRNDLRPQDRGGDPGQRLTTPQGKCFVQPVAFAVRSTPCAVGPCLGTEAAEAMQVHGRGVDSDPVSAAFRAEQRVVVVGERTAQAHHADVQR